MIDRRSIGGARAGERPPTHSLCLPSTFYHPERAWPGRFGLVASMCDDVVNGRLHRSQGCSFFDDFLPRKADGRMVTLAPIIGFTVATESSIYIASISHDHYHHLHLHHPHNHHHHLLPHLLHHHHPTRSRRHVSPYGFDCVSGRINCRTT